MQTVYASDPTNPWHFFPRGGHTDPTLGDPSTSFNFFFHARGGNAMWGQVCGVAVVGAFFVNLFESGGNDTYADAFYRHFESGRFPTPWSIEDTLPRLNAAGNSNYVWKTTTAYDLTRGSTMCHGIMEKIRKKYNYNVPTEHVGGLCAQASMAAAIEFIFKFLNKTLRNIGNGPETELAGQLANVVGGCTKSGCHDKMTVPGKSDCRACHK